MYWPLILCSSRKDWQRNCIGFSPMGIFPIESIWFKRLDPSKFLWIPFLCYNPIGFLTRGETSWKNSFESMTTMTCTQCQHKFPAFFLRCIKQHLLLIPVFLFPVGFQVSWHSIPAIFLFLCFSNPTNQRGLNFTEPALLIVSSTPPSDGGKHCLPGNRSLGAGTAPTTSRSIPLQHSLQHSTAKQIYQLQTTTYLMQQP